MKIWWVNQGSTYKISKEYSCLWAPIKTYRGIELTYWRTMTEVKKGDIIVHYSKREIRAISKAISSAYLSEQPKGFQSDSWVNNEGRKVDLTLFEINPSIPFDEIALSIQELNLHQGPLNKNGKPKQSYLHRFSIEGLKILREVPISRFPVWATLG